MTIVPRRISELPTLASSSIDGSEFLIIQQGPTTFKTQAAGFLGGGGGSISGDGINFASVTVTSDAVTNGDNLRTAYAAAKILTPNGSPLSATNRSVVLVPPGNYNLGTTPLTMDTQYVDLIGLTDQPNQVLITSAVATDYLGTLVQTANDVLISGVTLENSQVSNARNNNDLDPAAYAPSSNLTLAKLTNVVTRTTGLAWSMRVGITYSGTFTNCTGDVYSFGATLTASGTFTNCTSAAASFGALGTASGIFTNCTGGNYAFGGDGGGGGTASGIFTNCTGGNYAFGGGASGTISGTTCRLFFCRLTAGTFNTRTNGAKIKVSFAVDTEVNDV